MIEAVASARRPADPVQVRKADSALCRQMTVASHILYVEGQNDMNNGQISARVAGEPAYWIRSAALGFDEVTETDFALVDLDGRRVAGSVPVPSEWPIHAAIYGRRSDVNAVVHTHAPFATVMGTLGRGPRALSHDGCLFQGRLDIFDATTNTIVTPEMAARVADSLKSNPAVLLKNHGIVTVGRSVKEAVLHALLLERACMLELKLPAGAPASPSPDGEIPEKNGFIFSDAAVAAYWQYYARKVARCRTGSQLPVTGQPA
jgi:L-fuculose-phosphate aldolase